MKRIFKRAVALVLAVAMLCSLLCLSAFASVDTSMQMSVVFTDTDYNEIEKAKVGDLVYMGVKLENYTPVISYGWKILYDNEILDFADTYAYSETYGKFTIEMYKAGVDVYSPLAPGEVGVFEEDGRIQCTFAASEAVGEIEGLAVDCAFFLAFTVIGSDTTEVQFNTESDGQFIWETKTTDGVDIPTTRSSGSLKCVEPGVNLDKTEVTVDGISGGTVEATVIDANGEEVASPTLTVTPADGGVTVSGSTITVDAKATAGTYTVSDGTNSAALTVTRQAEVVTSVTVSPASATIDRPVAGADANEQTFTATVYNQYDEIMNGQTVQWSATGGTIDDGVLSVGNDVKAGNYIVTATVSGVSGTADVTVTADPVAASVVIDEAPGTELTVPAAGEEKTVTYTAVVYDQYGDEMTGETVTWSSEINDLIGVTADNGTLTIPVLAGTGTVKLTASCGSLSDELTVNVHDIQFAYEEVCTVSSDLTYGKTWGNIITIGAIEATLKGSKVAGEYSLSVDKNAVPDVGEYNVNVLFNGNGYTNVVVATVTVDITEAVLTNVTENVEEIVYIVNDAQALHEFTATTVDGSAVTVTYGKITGDGASYFDYDAANGTIKVKAGTTDDADGQTATIPVTLSAANHTSVERTITVVATKKSEVVVTFADAASQTYNVGGYALGEWFGAAYVPTGYDEVITYSYNGKTYSYEGLHGVTVTNAGTYTVTAYYEDTSSKGSATATFTIDKAPVTEPVANPGLVYDGTEQTGVEIADNDLYELADGSSNKGTNADEYTTNLVLKDIANYEWAEGSDGVVEWSIARKVIDVPAAETGLVYNDSVLTGVESGAGYSITGNTGTNAGSYTATATLDNNHVWMGGSTDAAEISWSISPKSITATVETTVSNVTYNGSEQKPAVTVKDGETVIDPSEYSASYSDNINAGTATVTVTDKENGNYTVSGSGTFTIDKAPVSVPAANPGLVYNGSEQTGVTIPPPYLYEPDENDGELNWAIDAGEYTTVFVLTDPDNYEWAEDDFNGEVAWSISPKTVSEPTIEIDPDSFTYTGAAQTPNSVIVKDGGTVIDAGEYTVSYSNNTNAGTASVTITDKDGGNYIVSGSKSFAINKADQAALSIDCADTVTYGQTLALSTTGGTGDGAVTYAVTNDTGSATVNGNILTATQAGSVTVIATKAESENYKEISSAAFIVTINPVQVAKPAADSQNYIYTGSVQTYQVTENDAYTVSNNKRTAAGSQVVTVALKDKVNYAWADNSTADLSFTFEIQKQTLTIDPVWNASSFVYDKNRHEVSIASGVDMSKVNVTYEGNTATDAGNYTATATFAPKDADNYSVERDSATHSWSITKAAQQQLEMQTISVRYSNTDTQTYTAEQIKALIGDTNSGTTITIESLGVTANGLLNTDVTGHDDDKVSFALKSGLSSDHTDSTALLTVYYSSNNYEDGVLSLTVKVMNKEDVSSAITFEAGSGTYNGQQHSHETATVSENMTGTITYNYEGDRVNKGTFQVTATYEDADNYGTKTVTYTINPKSVTVVWTNTELTYNGAAQKPSAAAETGVQNETLTVSVAGEQIDASETAYTATASITNTNYTLTNVTTDYTISPKSVEVVWTNTELTYNGSAQKPTASVETGITGQTLTPDVAGEQTNVGEYTATASTTNTNYTLTNATKDYTISPKSVEVVWGSETAFTYNGSEQAPTVSVETGIVGETLIPTVTGKQVNASETPYTATATTDDGNYALTNVTKEYTINPKPVAVVWTNTALTFNGSAQAPTAAVTEGIVDADSVPLTVTGQQTNVGSYNAAVTTTNTNYTLTNASTAFAIGKAAAPTLGVDGQTTYKYTVTGEKQVVITGIPANAGDVSYGVATVSGQTFALEGTPAAADGKISFTLAADAEDVGKPVSITVTVTMANYADADVTVELTIVEKDVPVLTVEDVTVDYTGTALTADAIIGTAKFDSSDVAGSWSWVTDMNTLTNAGNYTATVKFIPEDGINYAEVTEEVAVTVNKVKVTVPSAVTGLVYNTTEQTGVILPDGGKYTLTGNTGTNAGTYTATATLTDSANYEWASTFAGTIQWSIAKAVSTGTPGFTKINSADKTLADVAVDLSGMAPSGGAFKWVDAEGNELESTVKVEANKAYKWVYTPADTANYEAVSDTVVLYVYYVYVPSTPSTPSTSTDVTENEDGSITTTVTDSKTGTVTETTENVDGSTTVVETKKDGTVTESNTTVEGVTGTTVTDAQGNVTEIAAEIPTEAAKAGETVAVPVEVPVAASTEEAVEITVTVAETVEQVAVEIPVADVTPGSVVIIVHSDGTEEVVKKSNLTETGLVVMLEGSATVKVVDNSKTFVDVDPDEWYADGVDFASGRELYNGVGDDRFDPSGTMTRGMLVTVLHRMEDEMEHNYDGFFHDVAEGQWYTDAVHWAADHGIVEGYGNDHFGTGDSITREQMFTMVYRYLKWLGLDTSARGDLSVFTDGCEVSSWAVEAMEWAVGAGVVNGVGDNRVDPEGNATRAQVAVFLQRVINLMY